MPAVRDELLNYYERELAYLRRLGAEFAEKYPKVAGRLLLEPTKSEDPHVERLLEGFAFLAARVHLKLDDEFSQVSEALLDVMYPHYLRPLPSMSLVEFHLDPALGKLPAGVRIPRDATLYSRPVGGVPCRFRTCYDTMLWPVTVAAAEWLTPDRLRPAVRAPDAVAALRLELRCLPGLTFSQLKLDTLRLHISAESALATTLYELLGNNCVRVMMREPAAAPPPPPGAGGGARPAAQKSITLPPSVLRPVGFAPDEGMLPFAGRSFLAYRLLQEYFTFPEKFLFFDVAGFDRARAAGFGAAMEVVLLISPFERTERRPMLEAGVNARTFRPGCSPVVNLFKQTSEPILLNQRTPEYLIVPDARRRLTTEIFSVDDVVGIMPGTSEPVRFGPFHARARGEQRAVAAGAAGGGAYWYAARRFSGWRTDTGTDVFLALVDRTGRP
ncbi:MAG TPA: type VI secretion system baseplate subunit TssF, partial [Gemmatimonadaceae bacterium]|nr:type VI secretion system baseplate subunit TssF [Gemmatimonadaceae bacterium]